MGMLFWGRGVLKLMEENLFVRFIAALVWGDESYFLVSVLKDIYSKRISVWLRIEPRGLRLARQGFHH
jgi:hypothetical protein